MNAAALIAALDLKPHPEGGHFRETFRHAPPEGGRGAMTAIYYLLQDGEVSAWHRVDAAEIWHFYAGAPLALSLSPDGKRAETKSLGADIAAGERPQLLVPQGHWQSARSRGAWTLVGCTVGPAFEFSGFELAPRGWSPG
ncbi:MAG TPA: cupin domain-containing protein [Alphaproteobacteria bacterium]|nr:cupin domain-containing protein [Alphaproteobacteria bacterium]